MTKAHYFDTTHHTAFHNSEYGGSYVPESIQEDLDNITKTFSTLRNDPEFLQEVYSLMKSYIGRPSPLYKANNLTKHYKKATIYLKREDLNHTGAHKINNTLGQIYLAKRMNKTKIIAETGAGQHGVATATVCALLDMSCEIYMGTIDMDRQKPNVKKIELLGAKVIPVSQGTKTLKDAVDKALEVYSKDTKNIYYLIGSAVGPEPYPEIVRFFQSVIGMEMKDQLFQLENKLPDYIVACVGGGSNALGAIFSFINDDVKFVLAEAGGLGVHSGKNAATLTLGKIGVLHGYKTLVLQNDDGRVLDTYSISAGLDYPGVGPEIAFLNSVGRVLKFAVLDDEAIKAFYLLCRLEGIIPAFESAHAVAALDRFIGETEVGQVVVVNISGRGDKDLDRLLEINL